MENQWENLVSFKTKNIFIEHNTLKTTSRSAVDIIIALALHKALLVFMLTSFARITRIAALICVEN